MNVMAGVNAIVDNALTYYVKIGVQYCKTHIYPYTILGIIIMGKHFPQTRRSHDRDLAKAWL